MPALKRIDLKDGLRMHPGEWVSTYIAKAEGLIELLEIHDCGSVGGFDVEAGGDSMHGCTGCSTWSKGLKPSSVSTLLRRR
jgi:hypothetical protein